MKSGLDWRASVSRYCHQGAATETDRTLTGVNRVEQEVLVTHGANICRSLSVNFNQDEDRTGFYGRAVFGVWLLSAGRWIPSPRNQL